MPGHTPEASAGRRGLSVPRIGAAVGLLIAFFALRGEELTGRAIGAAVARSVLGASALGALIGAASNWRR